MNNLNFFLFLVIIVNVSNLTSKYHTSCLSGAPKSGLITSSDCQEYSRDGSYCCLLYYVGNPDLAVNVFLRVEDNPDREVGRKLSERENLCYGLTADGYYNILEVIDELEDESGIEEININCFSRNINLSILTLIFLIFF